jgi:hypothetical protein
MAGQAAVAVEARKVIAIVQPVEPVRLWSGASGDPTARKEHEDRERSLLFVAATRARDQLIVTSWGTPSPFLAGAGMA